MPNRPVNPFLAAVASNRAQSPKGSNSDPRSSVHMETGSRHFPSTPRVFGPSMTRLSAGRFLGGRDEDHQSWFDVVVAAAPCRVSASTAMHRSVGSDASRGRSAMVDGEQDNQTTPPSPQGGQGLNPGPPLSYPPSPAPPGANMMPRPPPMSSADRVFAAWQRRGETDYIFDYWTALGWTILTLGIYG